MLGSLVPLGMFLSWEAVALSLLPSGLADAPAAASVLEAGLQLAPGTGAPLAVDAAVTLDAAAAGLVADTSAALAVDPLEVRCAAELFCWARWLESHSLPAYHTRAAASEVGAAANFCCV